MTETATPPGPHPGPAADPEPQKRLAAEAAVGEIRPGMIVGLGTGSTAAYAIAALGRLVAGGLAVTAVATFAGHGGQGARRGHPRAGHGPLRPHRPRHRRGGRDRPRLRGDQGRRRGDAARESDRRRRHPDDRHRRRRQGGRRHRGARPVPVEVLPLACEYVSRAVADIGAIPTLRPARAGTRTDDAGNWRTDQGNLILDCRFAEIADAAALAAALSQIPGALGHGLFVTEIDALYLGTAGGVVVRQRGGTRQ